jgi:hypothetical protein
MDAPAIHNPAPSRTYRCLSICLHERSLRAAPGVRYAGRESGRHTVHASIDERKSDDYGREIASQRRSRWALCALSKRQECLPERRARSKEAEKQKQ